MWDTIGATNWGRKTLLSDIFFKKPDKWFKIWFFLVNRANHKDNKQFKRGQSFTTYNEIAHYTGATKNQIDQFMRWSKKEAMLTTQKSTRGMIVSLLTYDKYQTLDNYKNGKETIKKRYTNDTINKNDKNVKNNKSFIFKDGTKGFKDKWTGKWKEVDTFKLLGEPYLKELKD